mmetsp:Transcript_10960/g.22816  ORF Transcript_10960/g.22816 Transcript_10960/m.22816 type:complete len:423 (+) Transcript_10960:153-1421(+)
MGQALLRRQLLHRLARILHPEEGQARKSEVIRHNVQFKNLNDDKMLCLWSNLQEYKPFRSSSSTSLLECAASLLFHDVLVSQRGVKEPELHSGLVLGEGHRDKAGIHREEVGLVVPVPTLQPCLGPPAGSNVPQVRVLGVLDVLEIVLVPADVEIDLLPMKDVRKGRDELWRVSVPSVAVHRMVAHHNFPPGERLFQRQVQISHLRLYLVLLVKNSRPDGGPVLAVVFVDEGARVQEEQVQVLSGFLGVEVPSPAAHPPLVHRLHPLRGLQVRPRRVVVLGAVVAVVVISQHCVPRPLERRVIVHVDEAVPDLRVVHPLEARRVKVVASGDDKLWSQHGPHQRHLHRHLRLVILPLPAPVPDDDEPRRVLIAGPGLGVRGAVCRPAAHRHVTDGRANHERQQAEHEPPQTHLGAHQPKELAA